MTRPGTGIPRWVMVDEGWGRKAADFATLSEPGNCREYVYVHHRLDVDAGGPAARRGVRVRAGHRVGPPARRFLLWH